MTGTRSLGRERTWPQLLSLLAGIVVAACGASTDVTPPAPSFADPATFDDPPPGRAVWFESASLGEDRSELNLEFVGAAEYSPDNPCSAHYFGWARERDGILEAKIVDDTPDFANPNPNLACADVGYSRHVTVELAAPFRGNQVRDLAGYVHFVGRPDGLAELTKLPAGWTLTVETDVTESPTGRWTRSWARDGFTPVSGSLGKIDLYQAFDGPAQVSGGQDVSDIRINDGPATLYRAEDGELVLVWTLGSDGLALVVNEADFPVERAIELAESARVP